MNKYLIITVIGADRPGLVELLARTLVAHNANWLESRMANLAGRFAGMVEADVPEANFEPLVEALEKLQADGLKVMVDGGLAEPAEDSFREAQLELVGQDRVGIVQEISSALARHGVSIEKLHTQSESASMSGETLFRARAELRVPNDLDMEALQQSLELLADELMVDIDLQRQTVG
ncbi:MAG: glycine cleavage system protein R [Chromatiaceae bacterium]|nr:glycine cleavage system protein R [Gammaproteobacteria bacterium]MCB1880650.1 glycine cleavage system protein R [Gammaproteobacteria bacterium]MCP5447352.1 glycine cleavage system protein R [Chromatiaceae bacterium]